MVSSFKPTRILRDSTDTNTAKKVSASTYVERGTASFRAKFASFCFGAVVAGVAGYIQLQKDVTTAIDDTKVLLSTLQTNTMVLGARIQDLEKRFENIEISYDVQHLTQPAQ
uniref:Nostrin n=2 Tax=Lygus hesperus TaxID=30085 RepID=A0A0A9WWH6_LYGHE